MGNAETEYLKLKGLLETLGRVTEGKDNLLHDAGMALQGNTSNPVALGDLERNLRNARAKIMSELMGIINSDR